MLVGALTDKQPTSITRPITITTHTVAGWHESGKNARAFARAYLLVSVCESELESHPPFFSRREKSLKFLSEKLIETL